MPGRQLPVFTIWLAVSCISALVSVGPPLLMSTEGLGGTGGVMCPAVELLSWAVPMLALGATGGLGGALVLGSLTEGMSFGAGGLGAGTGALVEAGVVDGRFSVAHWGLGDTEGFSLLFKGWGTKTGSVFCIQEATGSGEVWSFGFMSIVGVSVDFKAPIPPETSSSRSTWLDDLGAWGKFLGFGATVGGDGLAGCPWRRGRGSGRFVTTHASTFPLLLSPQLPSASCCCSKAFILAFSVAMSSPSTSSSSSLSDWLSPLLSLR